MSASERHVGEDTACRQETACRQDERLSASEQPCKGNGVSASEQPYKRERLSASDRPYKRERLSASDRLYRGDGCRRATPGLFVEQIDAVAVETTALDSAQANFVLLELDARLGFLHPRFVLALLGLDHEATCAQAGIELRFLELVFPRA